jgi:hypothetical protein
LEADVTSPAPLGDRGAQLHAELLALKEFNPAEQILVVEMCRMADRLEQINDLVRSDSLIDLMQFRRLDFGGVEGEMTIKVTIDSVLAEGRQLQLAFQRMAATLNIESGAAAEVEVDLGDDLARQRADRIARAAG